MSSKPRDEAMRTITGVVGVSLGVTVGTAAYQAVSRFARSISPQLDKYLELALPFFGMYEGARRAEEWRTTGKIW